MTGMTQPTARDRSRSPGRRAWRTASALAFLGLALALLGPAGPLAQETGRCARVAVPWPIALPDGSTLDAETLQLCLLRKLNPVTGIHELRVDGVTRGMVRSRIGRSEGPATRDPIVVFRRVETGAHVLVGYAWPEGDAMRTFNLYHLSREGGTGEPIRELALERAPASEGFVLLAARRPN